MYCAWFEQFNQRLLVNIWRKLAEATRERKGSMQRIKKMNLLKLILWPVPD